MGRDEDVWGAVGEEFFPEMDEGIRSRSTQELKRPQLRSAVWSRALQELEH